MLEILCRTSGDEQRRRVVRTHLGQRGVQRGLLHLHTLTGQRVSQRVDGRVHELLIDRDVGRVVGLLGQRRQRQGRVARVVRLHVPDGPRTPRVGLATVDRPLVLRDLGDLGQWLGSERAVLPRLGHMDEPGGGEVQDRLVPRLHLDGVHVRLDDDRHPGVGQHRADEGLGHRSRDLFTRVRRVRIEQVRERRLRLGLLLIRQGGWAVSRDERRLQRVLHRLPDVVDAGLRDVPGLRLQLDAHDILHPVEQILAVQRDILGSLGLDQLGHPCQQQMSLSRQVFVLAADQLDVQTAIGGLEEPQGAPSPDVKGQLVGLLRRERGPCHGVGVDAARGERDGVVVVERRAGEADGVDHVGTDDGRTGDVATRRQLRLLLRLHLQIPRLAFLGEVGELTQRGGRQHRLRRHLRRHDLGQGVEPILSLPIRHLRGVGRQPVAGLEPVRQVHRRDERQCLGDRVRVVQEPVSRKPDVPRVDEVLVGPVPLGEGVDTGEVEGCRGPPTLQRPSCHVAHGDADVADVRVAAALVGDERPLDLHRGRRQVLQRARARPERLIRLVRQCRPLLIDLHQRPRVEHCCREVGVDRVLVHVHRVEDQRCREGLPTLREDAVALRHELSPSEQPPVGDGISPRRRTRQDQLGQPCGLARLRCHGRLLCGPRVHRLSDGLPTLDAERGELDLLNLEGRHVRKLVGSHRITPRSARP